LPRGADVNLGSFDAYVIPQQQKTASAPVMASAKPLLTVTYSLKKKKWFWPW
jgi:hypothetical protein